MIWIGCHIVEMKERRAGYVLGHHGIQLGDMYGISNLGGSRDLINEWVAWAGGLQYQVFCEDIHNQRMFGGFGKRV